MTKQTDDYEEREELETSFTSVGALCVAIVERLVPAEGTDAATNKNRCENFERDARNQDQRVNCKIIHSPPPLLM
jgi:hypothetical protein